MRASASAPTQPAASWARISPMTFSLNRTLRVRMASRSSFGRPARCRCISGNQQAFLEHLLAEARALAAADIDVMHAVDRVADDAIAVERGREDEDVGGLTVADPRIVADENIAGTRRLRWKCLDQLLAHHRHDADVAGGAEPGLADADCRDRRRGRSTCRALRPRRGRRRCGTASSPSRRRQRSAAAR